MKLFTFIADDAASALAQIHAQLGEDAVVVSVRPVAAEGMAGFLTRRKRIEVVAGVPETETPAPRPAPPQPRQSAPAFNFPPAAAPSPSPRSFMSPRRWPTLARLEQAGLSAENADRLQGELERLYGGSAPNDPEYEGALVRGLMASHWNSPPPLDDGGMARPHVFIGPPGSGKTTVLCKWMTLAVLTEDKTAKVWRLDGGNANTAEWLSTHCELLGVPLERFWSPAMGPAELLFVDLPGIETGDTPALAALCGQLATFGMPRIHLVLNAAYDAAILQAQWRAYSAVQPEDVIFTHLDEVPSPAKLWNFQFNTPCSLRFLSGSQKIPGEFKQATPAILLG